MLRGKTPLLIALALGVLAGLAAYSGIKLAERKAREGWSLVEVLVASVEIPEGTTITSDMISKRQIPDQFVTASVVKPDSSTYVINSKVLVTLQRGDPLLWSQFETTKATERLSTKVYKKGRAVTIQASGTTAVGGWVRPNDHVDIIGTFREPDTNEQVSVTLLQNIIVLATGKITGTTNVNLIPESQRDYTTISLLVIPEEAEVLVLAEQLGALSLTLRNEDDTDLINERGRATIKTLLSGERTRALEKRRFETITVIRGSTGEKTTVGGGAVP